MENKSYLFLIITIYAIGDFLIFNLLSYFNIDYLLIRIILNSLLFGLSTFLMFKFFKPNETSLNKTKKHMFYLCITSIILTISVVILNYLSIEIREYNELVNLLIVTSISVMVGYIVINNKNLKSKLNLCN